MSVFRYQFHGFCHVFLEILLLYLLLLLLLPLLLLAYYQFKYLFYLRCFEKLKSIYHVNMYLSGII